MKKINAFIFIFTVCTIFISCNNEKSARIGADSTATSAAKTGAVQKAVAYTYGSFLGEWGAGEKIAELFTAATGYEVEFVNCGDGAQILSRAILEKQNVQADILLGIDNNLADRARRENVLTPYKPQNADKIIDSDLQDALGGDWLLTPFDYSHFAIIYDTKSNVPTPSTLTDLTKDIYRKKLILMDPRTSTPGLGFLAWTLAAFGENYTDFWRNLYPNILTVAPGWSSGYGLFTSGEAPMVISYETSAAAGIEYENSDRFQTLVFNDGHVMQVEGAGLVRGAKHEEAAKAFIDFLISDEAQKILPLTQWMYPVNKNAELPQSYKSLPKITRTLKTNAAETENALAKITSIIFGN